MFRFASGAEGLGDAVGLAVGVPRTIRTGAAVSRTCSSAERHCHRPPTVPGVSQAPEQLCAEDVVCRTAALTQASQLPRLGAGNPQVVRPLSLPACPPACLPACLEGTCCDLGPARRLLNPKARRLPAVVHLSWVRPKANGAEVDAYGVERRLSVSLSLPAVPAATGQLEFWSEWASACNTRGTEWSDMLSDAQFHSQVNPSPHCAGLTRLAPLHVESRHAHLRRCAVG